MDASVQVAEVEAVALARQLQAGEDLQILDVRLPARVAAGRIDLVPARRFHNIMGSRVRALRTLDGTRLDPALPIVVVCARGDDSRLVAAHLSEMGCDAASLRGGMAAWMQVVVPRPLVPPPSLDRFVQFDRPGKGSLAYLLVSDGEALIVDPPRDATSLVAAARHAGACIVGVADTHVHADYISGAPSLSRMLGVPYYLNHRDAVSPYDSAHGRLDFTSIEDGRLIPVGRCAVRVMHTPGHTEGSVCYVIDDVAALTGDFLFVASVGRPDLAGQTELWTVDLWNSLQKARDEWRPDLVIYPAHYASAEEVRPDGVIASSFAYVVQHGEAFRAPDLAAFAHWVQDRGRSFPDTYRRIKRVNLGIEFVDDHGAEELEVGRNECALG